MNRRLGHTLSGALLGAVLMLCSACDAETPPRGTPSTPAAPPTVTMTILESPLRHGEYHRGKLFGYDYTDADRDGCDTREEMLAAPGPCPPAAATRVSIVDPYTGQTVTGRTNIDVEHIIPTGWWFRHGAAERSREERLRFANDYGSPDGVDNVILVSASENRRKGDRGPSEYLPPDPKVHCWYATRWRDLLVEYRIVLPPTDPDAVALERILRTC
jgi:hypothetical protein